MHIYIFNYEYVKVIEILLSSKWIVFTRDKKNSRWKNSEQLHTKMRTFTDTFQNICKQLVKFKTKNNNRIHTVTQQS